MLNNTPEQTSIFKNDFVHCSAAVICNSVAINQITAGQLIDTIAKCIQTGTGITVTYAHACTLAAAAKDKRLPEYINKCDICIPDGISVGVFSKLTGGPWLQKCTFNHCFDDILSHCAYVNGTVALIGAKFNVAKRGREIIASKLGSSELVVAWDGYSCDENKDMIMERLKETQPQIIVLGMGQPKQERWATELAAICPSCVTLCVGGYIDVLAGELPKYPRCCRRIPLEWAFRIATRPRTMLPRYSRAFCVLVSKIASRRYRTTVRLSEGD